MFAHHDRQLPDVLGLLMAVKAHPRSAFFATQQGCSRQDAKIAKIAK